MKLEDPRADRSRRSLIVAAIDLLLQNPTASMSEIAERAGVGRATLHRHFRTRDHLIDEISLQSLREIELALEEVRLKGCSAIDELKAGFRALMPIADKFHFLLTVWCMVDCESKSLQIYLQQIERLSQLVERGKIEGDIKKSISTSWLVHTIDSMVYVGWWSVRSGEQNPEQAANMAIDTLFDGIIAR